MSVVNNTLLLAAGAEAPYEIERSLRFRSSASAYLNRTLASSGNRKTFTYSCWTKRGLINTNAHTFGITAASSGSSARSEMEFDGTANEINIGFNPTGSAWFETFTNAVFRDPSAWYHIVVSVDMTQATDTNRLKVYVNGVSQTFRVYSVPAQNTDLPINDSSLTHSIGRYQAGGTSHLDGYLTEINFVDGQALTPSDFGEYNEDTGVWQPIKYAGTYGTNGFYLNFSDNASTTTLGDDLSGNGNDWTTNNISLTAGATYDSMIDTPTPYDDGGNGRGNYCTLNPVGSDMGFGSLSNGNLTATTNFRQKRGTIGVNTGKWYWEVLCVSDANPSSAYAAGVVDVSTNVATNPFSSGSGAVFYYGNNGNKYINGTQTSYGSTYTTNDVIGVALDMDSGTVTFYKNNTSQGSVTLHSATAIYVPLVHSGSSDPNNTVYAANFGQRPFAYTPPTGFKALNTQNLPESTVVDGGEYFNAVLYTGNGSTNAITGVGFQPDFVWAKQRNTTGSNAFFDAVRGVGKSLRSDQTSAEETQTDSLTSFDSDGFSLGANTQAGPDVNFDVGGTFVAWNWKANGAGVSNTDGSITSTVSANTTAGFSVVTWTNPASGTPTIGHGLGVAPTFIIVKDRTFGYNWDVGCDAIGWANRINLNTTDAAYSPAFWNSTAPTSTVFTYTASGANSGDSMVAYCFAPVAGYSAFGSYTGNGSADGPFVFCGFRPRYVMIKRTDTSGTDWVLLDSSRDPENVVDQYLAANLSDAEGVYANDKVDFLANGFKQRGTATGQNGSGGTFIYAAFAENPFKNSLAR
jgi:hypothetical protein